MRQLEERHVATKVELMLWSNKMDLLALSNVRGTVYKCILIAELSFMCCNSVKRYMRFNT